MSTSGALWMGNYVWVQRTAPVYRWVGNGYGARRIFAGWYTWWEEQP